jgi:hypothetical protein
MIIAASKSSFTLLGGVALTSLITFAPSVAEAGTLRDIFVPGGANYPIENPPTPSSPGGGDLHFRWVPLCEDGTGDHEWSATGNGQAPTCAASDYVRCIDGTRPLYYVDRARTADGTADANSNSWVFWFQGGGSCSDQGNDGAGDVCAGKFNTPGERDEMTSVDDPKSIVGRGILNPDRAENAFKTYNRVRIMKCSYDRFTGDATLSTSDSNGNQFDLFWHGRRMITAVLADLEYGITYREAGEPNSLPPLSDAFRVLFAGHSGGSGGLIFNIDWLATQIHTMRPAAKVRALIDARFKPGIENEAHFDTSTYSLADDTNGDNVIDVYDLLVPDPLNPGYIGGSILFEYHNGVFQAGGDLATQQDQWGVNLDATCESTYGVGAWQCRDELHVLLNHVKTPFFVRQALRDSNHIDGRVLWAADPLFNFASGPYKVRVLFQLASYYLGHHTKSIIGQGAFPPTWAMGVFASDTTVHAGNHDDEQFFERELCDPLTNDHFSYHDAVFEWFTYDTEVMMIQDPNAVTGEWCSYVGGACVC